MSATDAPEPSGSIDGDGAAHEARGSEQWSPEAHEMLPVARH